MVLAHCYVLARIPAHARSRGRRLYELQRRHADLERGPRFLRHQTFSCRGSGRQTGDRGYAGRRQRHPGHCASGGGDTAARGQPQWSGSKVRSRIPDVDVGLWALACRLKLRATPKSNVSELLQSPLHHNGLWTLGHGLWTSRRGSAQLGVQERRSGRREARTPQQNGAMDTGRSYRSCELGTVTAAAYRRG